MEVPRVNVTKLLVLLHQRLQPPLKTSSPWTMYGDPGKVSLKARNITEDGDTQPVLAFKINSEHSKNRLLSVSNFITKSFLK